MSSFTKFNNINNIPIQVKDKVTDQRSDSKLSSSHQDDLPACYCRGHCASVNEWCTGMLLYHATFFSFLSNKSTIEFFFLLLFVPYQEVTCVRKLIWTGGNSVGLWKRHLSEWSMLRANRDYPYHGFLGCPSILWSDSFFQSTPCKWRSRWTYAWPWVWLRTEFKWQDKTFDIKCNHLTFAMALTILLKLLLSSGHCKRHHCVGCSSGCAE